MLVSGRGSSVATNPIHFARTLFYLFAESGERRRWGTLGAILTLWGDTEVVVTVKYHGMNPHTCIYASGIIFLHISAITGVASLTDSVRTLVSIP